MILSELLYKLVLFCDIVRVGKNSYCEFDKFEVSVEMKADNYPSFSIDKNYVMCYLIKGNMLFNGGDNEYKRTN